MTYEPRREVVPIPDDLGEDDHDHLMSPEERLNLALAVH
jgi:hypothetical protein